MLQKRLALILCSSIFLARGALGAEACFDMDSVVVGSHSNEDALEQIERFKGAMVEYFFTLGDGEIPEEISGEEAEEIIDFLKQKGLDVKLLERESDRPWFRLPLGIAGGAVIAATAYSLISKGWAYTLSKSTMRRGVLLLLLGWGILLEGNSLVSEYLGGNDRCDPFSTVMD